VSEQLVTFARSVIPTEPFESFFLSTERTALHRQHAKRELIPGTLLALSAEESLT
jgi:hypothetical protein